MINKGLAKRLEFDRLLYRSRIDCAGDKESHGFPLYRHTVFKGVKVLNYQPQTHAESERVEQ